MKKIVSETCKERRPDIRNGIISDNRKFGRKLCALILFVVNRKHGIFYLIWFTLYFKFDLITNMKTLTNALFSIKHSIMTDDTVNTIVTMSRLFITSDIDTGYRFVENKPI